MLVTFRTEAHAGVTMFGEVAKLMLKKMGHSETIPGAILAEDVPAVLNTLTNAIKTDAVKKNQSQKSAWDDQDVSQQSRAMPLIELLKAAAEQECNVMWDVAGATEPGISI